MIVERFHKIPVDLARRLDLTGNDKIVFVVLAGYARETLSCWPGLGTLAKETGMARSSVQRSIDRLISRGFIEKENRGQNESNIYRIKTNAIPNLGIPKIGLYPKSVTNRKNNIIHTPPIPDLGIPKIGIGETFEKFWSAYPRKIARTAAEKSWKKINPSLELLNTMLMAIETQRQSDQWRKNSGKYIPYPATWLNQKRWTDEIQATLGEDDEHHALPWKMRNLPDEEFQQLQQEASYANH